MFQPLFQEWTFVIEETTTKQKTRPVASVSLNLKLFVQVNDFLKE
jgi:hypothetical protein